MLGRKKKEPKRISPKDYEEMNEEEGDYENLDDMPEEDFDEEDQEEEKPRLKKYPRKLKERLQVVKELPVQQVRKVKGDDGTVIRFITIEEALTELLE